MLYKSNLKIKIITSTSVIQVLIKSKGLSRNFLIKFSVSLLKFTNYLKSTKFNVAQYRFFFILSHLVERLIKNGFIF